MRKILIVAAALTAFVSGEAAAAKSSYTSSSTITYNGVTYQYSSSSTCADGTAALRQNRKWWCPVKTGTTTSDTTSTTTSTASSTWTKVADEGQSFTLSSAQTVRYGAGSSWVQKQLSGTSSCSNATFGSDPVFGVLKACEIASTSSTTSDSTTSTGGTTASTGDTSTVSTDSGSTTTSSSGPTTTDTTTSSDTTSGSTTTTVVAPVTYSANVSWTIPTTRADGSTLALAELTGYEVYYTNDSGSVSVALPIAGGGTVNAVVSNLASGNYYFSISAIDSSGLKSALSQMASITFP